MIRTVIFIFLLSTIITCAGQSQRSAQKKLHGKWSYVSSSGGFTGKGTGWLPENKVMIEFKKNGCSNFYEKGKKTSSDKYTVEFQKTIFSPENSPVINFTNSMDQTFEINNDTLFLKDNVSDGFSYIYKRKR